MSKYPFAMKSEIDGLDTRVDSLENSASTFETTSGAQARATAAENNAKAYADALLADVALTNVRVVATTNINISSPGATIDGVTLSSGDRVLLAGQTTGSQNGIYVFNGSSSAMTRATDFDTGAEFTAALLVIVEAGTTNGESLWGLNTDPPVTLGTTSLTFAARTGGASGYAVDTLVVHKSGTESIAGNKTFTGVLKTTAPLTPDMPEYYGGGVGGDDTAAINSAMGAMDQVKLTRGVTYRVTSSIEIGSNKRIFTEQGGYQGATIAAVTGYDTASGAVIRLTGTGSQLSNVAISASSFPTVNCIHATDTAFSPLIRDVKTTGGKNGFLNECLETHMQHCLFRLAAEAGVRNSWYDLLCVDVSTDQCRDGYKHIDGPGSATLFHFHAIKSSRRGYYLNAADRSLFFGCHADSSGQNGFHIENCSNVSFEACYSFFSSNEDYGGPALTYQDWYINGSDRLGIVNCQAGGASYTLADVRFAGTNSDAEFVRFRGNKAVQGSTTGVRFTACSGTLAQYESPIHRTLIDAKGDLIGGTAADTAARIAVGANGKALVADSLQTAGLGYGVPRNGNIGPSDHGLIAWSYDPSMPTNGTALTSGASKVVLLYVPYATTITNILLQILTAGTGLTSGQSFAALYNSDGTALLGQTADQSTAWASTGTKTMALTTPYAMTAPGLVKVVFWSVFSGTAPQVARVSPGASSIPNFGQSAAPYRTSTANTGLTTTAPTPLGAETASTSIPLVAIS